MAKWVTEIDRPERIPELVARAWTTALSGRPGPVVVALPEDVLSGPTATPPLTAPARIAQPGPDPDAVDDALALLASAKRPLALVSGSDWSDRARESFLNFAETSSIPVVVGFRFQDSFDNHSDAYAGEAAVGMLPHVKRLIAEADVILALNARFGEITTDGYRLLNVPSPRQKLIHVHASAGEIGKVYQPTLGIVAGMEGFAAALRPVQGDWADWARTARADYLASFDLPPQPPGLDMAAVMAHLREVLAEDAIITHGAGNFAVWPDKLFRYGPRQRLLAPQSGAMGMACRPRWPRAWPVPAGR